MTDVYSQVEWLTIPEVADTLQLPLGKVHRLLEEHQLVEARVDGVRKVPAMAIQDGEPLHSLRGTVLVLLDAGFSPEAAVEWLLTVEESLGTSPLSALVAGKKAEIRRLAQALAI